MSGNTIGKNFKVTNWGESHGDAIGVIIDGCPPRMDLSEKDIQKDLDRRAPGQSPLTTTRQEKDRVKILSGLYDGKTTGTPISLLIENKNTNKKDYSQLEKLFRPGHADFTYYQKYGIRDPYGGGRSSARMTAGNVAAGAIAKKILKENANTLILAYVKQIKDIIADIDLLNISEESIEANAVRCPDPEKAEQMMRLITRIKEEGDSAGGVIECIIYNVPIGLGDPIFEKISANLAKAIFSINAVKGFEIGSGFACSQMLGSEHNDAFVIEEGRIFTQTNHAGGMLGGITNGMPIIFRAAFKPTPTIGKKQTTVKKNGDKIELKAIGRHDPCVLPRAVPIVEAMAAITLCDLLLSQKKFQ